MPSVTGTIPQDRYRAAAYIHEHRNTLQRTLQHTATHVNAPCCMPSVAGTTQQDQRNLTEEPDRGSGSLRNLRARPPGLESTLTTFAPCALNTPLVSTGLFLYGMCTSRTSDSMFESSVRATCRRRANLIVWTVAVSVSLSPIGLVTLTGSGTCVEKSTHNHTNAHCDTSGPRMQHYQHDKDSEHDIKDDSDHITQDIPCPLRSRSFFQFPALLTVCNQDKCQLSVKTCQQSAKMVAISCYDSLPSTYHRL